jgi:peptidoglycan-N-acetylglucosamine deacetylase
MSFKGLTGSSKSKSSNGSSNKMDSKQAMHAVPTVRTEAPVFFDQNGRRWKTILTGLVAVCIIAGLFLYFTVPKILAHSQVTPLQAKATPGDAIIADAASGMSPTEVAAIVSRTNTPVIGSGPLVRVVHIQAKGNVTYAVPLYTATGTQALSNEDRQTIGSHDFAIQRYGKSTVPKQIALTYDDGPDPTYTPQVLDVLAKNGVQATFFDVGANVVKHPDVAAREAKEGHVIGNHTFDHVDFDFVNAARGQQEINQTTRVIASTTGHDSSFFRLPYMGNDEQSLRSHITGILTAQNLGYLITSNDYDSNDWEFDTGEKAQLPNLDGTSQIILLHDAGGDRSKTVVYTQKLIDEAKAKGYRFVTLNQMYSQSTPLAAAVKPSVADRTASFLASSYLVYPRAIVSKLFFFTIFTLFLTMIVNVLLAMYNMRKSRFGRRTKGYNPLVSVIMSAYNEEEVLPHTVRSILASNYRNLEIVIVDDGSKDNTGKVAIELAKRYKRVRAFTKVNGGKASGLNFGIKHAMGEIIIGIDADTIFPGSTVGRLVRHFVDPKVGAVAGNVKVGNLQSMITRWQMLDYIIGIYIERNAQSALGSVMIVPGACGAWRKSVILAAGGYRHHTLAEDFDLTLSVHRLGYKVLQDNSAMSYTEAPDNLQALTKQRFRWLYGTTQAFWKHRDMMFKRRYGWTGMFVMPYAIFTFLLPIVFIPILLIINIENFVAGNYRSIILFFFLTIGIQFIMATIAILFARERLSLLLAVPFTRLVYSPIRTTLLYRTILRAMRGNFGGAVWNTARAGTVQYIKPGAKRPLKQVPVTVIEQEEIAQA